jgi:rhamnose transport system substrate-binding protein
MKKIKGLFVAVLLSVLSLGAVSYAQDGFTLFMVPKFVGILYFDASQKGAEEAAAELGITLIHRGPNEASVPDQIELIENAITSGVDVVSLAANDPEALAPVLQKAKDAGIKVVTWDADANVRDIFVNQATFEAIGKAMVDSMVNQVGPDGKVAYVTTTLTAPNQTAWIKEMTKYIDANYPDLQILDTKAPGENQQKALEETLDLLKVYPDLQGIWAMGGVPFPGVAEAVKQAGQSGKIAVVGLATPLTMKPYVEDGTVRDVVLWSPVDLGYLSVYAANAVMQGDLKPGDKISAGRLGEFTVMEDEYGLQIVLGPASVWNKENIESAVF